MNFRNILQFIIYDPFRKIIAILFAFSLWFFVSLDGVYQQTKKVRVDYINLADSLVLTDSLSYIETILNGRGSALFSVWAAPIKARCDLEGLRPGIHDIPIDSISIPIPFRNIMIGQTVEKVSLMIDTIIKLQISIEVPISGTLKDGYSINDIVVYDTVSFIGPRGLIETMDFVTTETLDIKNKNASFTKQIKLATVSPLIQASQPTVTAEIFVDTTVEKQFTNIPLKLIFTPYQRVTSERISLDTLIVKGPRARMEDLGKGDITVRISLSQLASGDYNLPATIVLPAYIVPVYSSPQRFAITIH